MDKRFTPGLIAGWFMIAAIASLLFMGAGCAAFVMNVASDRATLPLDQRALVEAEPAWVLAVSGIGFVGGAIGALLLVLRRKLAVPFMLVSLLAMFVWIAGMFATPGFRDLLSTDQIAFVLVVVAVTWTIYWFARHSRQRGWLG